MLLLTVCVAVTTSAFTASFITIFYLKVAIFKLLTQLQSMTVGIRGALSSMVLVEEILDSTRAKIRVDPLLLGQTAQ